MPALVGASAQVSILFAKAALLATLLVPLPLQASLMLALDATFFASLRRWLPYRDRTANRTALGFAAVTVLKSLILVVATSGPFDTPPETTGVLSAILIALNSLSALSVVGIKLATFVSRRCAGAGRSEAKARLSRSSGGTSATRGALHNSARSIRNRSASSDASTDDGVELARIDSKNPLR